VTAGKIGAALKHLASKRTKSSSQRTSTGRRTQRRGSPRDILAAKARHPRAKGAVLGPTKWTLNARRELVDVDYPLAWSAESRRSVDLPGVRSSPDFFPLHPTSSDADFLSSVGCRVRPSP